jgi:hypothetical protein
VYGRASPARCKMQGESANLLPIVRPAPAIVKPLLPDVKPIPAFGDPSSLDCLPAALPAEVVRVLIGGIKNILPTLPRPREQSRFAKLVEKPMAQRGRKSAASLSIVSVLGNERPAPPDDLTEEEAEEWRAIVAVCRMTGSRARIARFWWSTAGTLCPARTCRVARFVLRLVQASLASDGPDPLPPYHPHAPRTSCECPGAPWGI